MKLTNQLIILIFLILITLVEINFFLYNLSGVDQIRHLSWVYFLSNSDHLLPLDFFKNYKTIYNDSFGFIYELLRYSYKDVGHILNIIPILIIYLFSFIFGLKPYLLNLVSIIFSSLSIFLAYKISLQFIQDNQIRKNRILPLIFLFVFSSSYIFYFSSLGVHNIALFFFLLTIYFFLKIEDFDSYKKNLYLCIFIALACYSHKINALILLLPITTYLFFNSKKKYQGLKNIILMSLNLLIFFSPIIFLILISRNTINDNLMYAAINLNPKEIIINFKTWFYAHEKNIGFINLIIFLLSILFFVFKKNEERTNKIFIIIFFHLVLSLIVSGFMNYHIRTSLYSTFLILIINFVFLASLIKVKKKIFFIFLGIIFFNFSQQIFIIYNKNYFKKFRADMYNFYFQNLDEEKFKSLYDTINKIDELVPNDGKIIFFTNLTEDTYFIHSKRKLKRIKYIYLKPIKNLFHYQKNHELENYLNKINYKKIFIENSYILSIASSNVEVIEEFNTLNKNKIFRNNCIIIPNFILEEKIFISGQKKIFLNKLKCN